MIKKHWRYRILLGFRPPFIPPEGGKILCFREFFSPGGGDVAKRQRGVNTQNKFF
jgi:hypothetical protein